MAAGAEPVVALIYEDDAYVEAVGSASGPMGRQVAGQSFLDALLRHGRFSELAAIVRDRPSAAGLVATWREHAANRPRPRTLRIIERAELSRSLFPAPSATVIHAPQPPEPGLAWARQQGGPHAFALSGVTHTLGSADAVALLRELVTAPFEPYDALICTSRAVERMVREVTGTYADYLRSRLGGTAAPERTVRLEAIPLGVDVDRFRPASSDERAAARRALGVADDELAVLFVGRLSHHAKAHPFPLFRAAGLAARQTGRSLHLILAGWSAHSAVREAFREGARALAPVVRTSIVDGREPATRRFVWHAADMFASPSDSIQETFGLAVVEAMASGLPVVASDWDGYRDLVDDGETGFLVPTAMVEGATVGASARLLCGELSYDHFLAECSQAVAVDVPAMAVAIARLADDDALRRRMGEAGRRRARDQFAWPSIVRRYEELWRDQDERRRALAGASARVDEARWRGPSGPAAYPGPERSFAGYPTRVLDFGDRLAPAPGAVEALGTVLALPLTNHAAGRRAGDPSLIRAAIARAPCTLSDVDGFWSTAGVEHGVGRATVAWMLKYDLIRVDRDQSPAPPEGDRHE
ncbi:MAG: glycosyltransferase family 4 protein [Isosphaeraceae bacterium]